MMSLRRLACIGLSALITAAASAQKPPAIRAIGKLERVSSDPLSGVATALPMPGGRVLVNDLTSRRVLLFDSTLAHPIVVADTTSATANAYGDRAGTLIAYRGDSALFIDLASLSMMVIDPTGKVGRVMAIPRPNDSQSLIGDIFGTPGFDGRGRLVYYGMGGVVGTPIMCCVGRVNINNAFTKSMFGPRPDSAYLVRVDLATRTMDTAAAFKIPKVTVKLNADAQGFVQSLQVTHDIHPMVDAWTVSPDGSIAIVRGRDYHVDWITPDGKAVSTPKMPFDWQRLDDARKQVLIDSVPTAEQTELDRFNAERDRAAGGGGSGGGRGGGRGDGGRAGGSGGAPAGGGRGVPVPLVFGRLTLNDLPDYLPPIGEGAVRADADGHLWIRTTTIVNKQPVYDIVDGRGALVDRVQLPPFRTIAGFAPGVIYMAVKDASGNTHLERARIR